ncbi:hypothetical protein SH2C18_04150 [Clostridium sediminicola]|uniref:hypothetical protein n=1 Tax=Clostridium sediminicola TaxID=3114879 RepID=UPI0031F1FF2D
MPRCRNAVIAGEVVGEMTEELKRAYARQLARALLAEHGAEKCKKILEGLKKSTTSDK